MRTKNANLPWFKRSLGFLTVAGLAVLLSAGSAWSEVVHLRTGRAVKGKILESETDESRLVMNEFMSGARLVFRWEAVDQADADRIMEDLGLKNAARQPAEGHRVELKLNDGSTEEIYGLVTQEGPPTLILLQEGREVKIPTSRVASVTKAMVTPLEIWSAEQLWERFMEQEIVGQGIDPDNMDGTAHFRAGEYAEYLEMYEKAREHYTAASTAEGFVRARVASKRLENVEALIRDAEARKLIREINQKVGLNSFDRARELMERFKSEHQDVSDATKARFSISEKKFHKKRDKIFAAMAGRKYVGIVKDLLEAKAKGEDELSITEGVAYTRRELIEDSFKALAALMQRRDSTVDEGTARKYWDARRKRGYRSASFGAGTFIVKPPEVKPPSRRRGGNNARRRGGNQRGGGAAAPIPKPPTRDGFWAAAKTQERVDWLFAYFVQNSGLFDVAEKPQLRPCPTCNAVGLQSRQNSNGTVTYYLCTRCAGSQQDLTLRYR